MGKLHSARSAAANPSSKSELNMDQIREKSKRTLASLAERCRRISNLFMAYHNSGKSSEVFGREFYHAVGDILNGTPLHRLEVFHVDPKKIPEVLPPIDTSGPVKTKSCRH